MTVRVTRLGKVTVSTLHGGYVETVACMFKADIDGPSVELDLRDRGEGGHAYLDPNDAEWIGEALIACARKAKRASE